MKQLKKFLCGILSAAMLIISVSVPVMAAEELTDDGLFMLHHDGTTQDVWLMRKEYDSEQNLINTQISGDVIIPSKIKGYDVTGIDIAGFAYCLNIKSITIPDTVKTIGHSAFNNCTGLEKVTIPSSVTKIDDYAFAECKTLQEIVIPDSVTSIGEGAFAGCENLGAIQLSDNITDIPELAFTAIGWMPEIKIPSKVKVIEPNAFLNTSLDNVYIPKSVTEIQDNAFPDYIFLTVYYEGTEADWQKIKIGAGNEWLLSANREYSAYDPSNNKDIGAPSVTEAPKNNGTVTDNKEISVYINGKQVVFDVPPQIINDRTMVPLRAIFEALGASVDWNQDARTVTSTKGNTTIQLTIDSNTMYVNGNTVTLDSPACIINDRTLVPVRAISEAYNTKVDWNGDTRTVTITSDASTEASSAASQELTQDDISITLKIPTNGGYNWYAEMDVQNNSDATITFPSMAGLNGTLIQSSMGSGSAKNIEVEPGKRKKLSYYTFDGRKDMYLDNNSIGYFVIRYNGTQYYVEYGVNGIITFYKGNVNGPAE